MRNGLLCVGVVLLISGCAGNGPGNVPLGPSEFGADDEAPAKDQTPANQSLPPAAADQGPSVFQFEGEFDVTVTQLMVNNNRINLDRNCVNFGKGSVWLVFNGTATATWTANNPLSQRLEIEIWDGGGQGRLYANAGSASPSRLDFGQFRITQASTLGLAFMIQPSDPGVVAGQTVKVALSFSYIGRPELPAKPVPCTYPEPSPLEGEE